MWVKFIDSVWDGLGEGKCEMISRALNFVCLLCGEGICQDKWLGGQIGKTEVSAPIMESYQEKGKKSWQRKIF